MKKHKCLLCGDPVHTRSTYCVKCGVEQRRKTGYYSSLAQQGLEIQMKYFRRNGHAIGAENRREGIKKAIEARRSKKNAE